MSKWKIAWRSITQRSLASSLTGLSMALGVMLVVAVLVVHGVINQSFLNEQGLGYNLVVGAKGGRLDLVLNSVYYLARPVENIPYTYYQEFTQGKFKPFVEKAIPLCLGDMYGDFRVIGTTPAFFDELEYGGKRYEFAQGRNFKQSEFFGAVVGATVAREKGLKVGSKFEPSHGVGPDAHTHDAFKVVGVLKPTGTPNDRALFINMEGFYLIPEHAKPDEDPPAAKSKPAAHDDHEHDHAHEHGADEHPKHDPAQKQGEGAHAHADHEHDHEHAEHDPAHEQPAQPASTKTGGEAAEPKHDHPEHDHDHDHEHADHKHEDHKHDHGDHKHDHAHDEKGHAHDDHEHDHAHDHKHAHDDHDHHDHDGHDHHGHDHDHAHHHHAHEPLPIEKREVTAILVLTKSISLPGSEQGLPELTAMSLMRPINKDSVAQAVQPIREMSTLFDTFVDPLRIILLGLTVMIVVVSGIGILVSIYNSMSERQHEIAVMRALGAGRQTVMLLVLMESILLSLAGGLAGWVVGHGLIAALSPWIIAQTGVPIGFFNFVPYELVIIPGLIALAALVGYLPAMAAYRTDVAKALSANP